MHTSDSATDTHCPYCALQCGMRLRPEPGGATVAVEERADFPVNRGALCGKGRTAPAVLSSRVRLTEPLVRTHAGRLEPATWEEALDAVAAGLTRTSRAYGPDAVGVFGGGGLTNEKAYALGKFARVALRTSQIDYNGRFCMSSAAAAHQRAFGLDRGLPFPLEDIPRTGCVILVGSNLAETMPPALRYLTELKANGGTLIVIDPRRTRTAEQADLHLAPRPGTDLALALGLLHLIVAEGRTDAEFIAARTTGWEGPGPQRWPTGRNWWSASPGYRSPGSARPWRCSALRNPPWSSPPGAPSSSPRAPTPSEPGSTCAWPPAGPAARSPATGASPGRATARAAASTARRPTSCPATASSPTRRPAPTSPGSGASTPTPSPARAAAPTNSSTPSART